MLRLIGTNGSKIVRVTPDFFEPTKVQTKFGKAIITPLEKAEDMGKDYFGADYRGFSLEMNGKLIEKEAEKDRRNPVIQSNKLLKPLLGKNVEKAHQRGHLSTRLHSMFKF